MGVNLSGKLIIETYTVDGVIAGRWEAGNAICNNGLSTLAAAMAYLFVEDIAADLSIPTAVAYPIYGAIGIGDMTANPVSSTDTQLVNEIARVTAASSGSTPAALNTPATVSFQFQFPINTTSANISVTEAGIFALAQEDTNSGQMLDHATFTSNPSWNVNQYLTLTLQLSLAGA